MPITPSNMKSEIMTETGTSESRKTISDALYSAYEMSWFVTSRNRVVRFSKTVSLILFTNLRVSDAINLIVNVCKVKAKKPLKTKIVTTQISNSPELESAKKLENKLLDPTSEDGPPLEVG